MRKIVVFNQDRSYRDSLNIFAKLARQGKRVLLIDLRQQSLYSKSISQVDFDITSCLESTGSLQKYIKPLEMNLDVIEGSSKLQLLEFRIFSTLFKFDVFEKEIGHLDYDYVIFEMSFILDLLTLNALFVCSEVIVFHELLSDAIYDVGTFLKDFNALYSHKILCSLVIPTYTGKLDEKEYTSLVSSFFTDMISYPLKLDKSSLEYKKGVEEIARRIIDTEDIFSPQGNFSWALEKQKHYEQVLHRISRQ